MPLGFYCDVHRGIDDVPIAAAANVRVVTVTAELLFSGVSFDRPIAQAEALLTLERAVEAVGGEVRVRRVTSAVARYAIQPCAAREKAG